MSTTRIYRLGRDPECIGETRNAWRGSMYIWNDIAKRYCGLERFPLGLGFPGEQTDESRVWNSFKDHRLAEHERIALATTMDDAAIYGRDREAVATAFEKYAGEHPDSSFAEQATIIRAADIKPDDLIAWQQTSVAEFWGQRWNDEAEDYDWYDPTTNKHFDAYAAATYQRAA